MFILLCPGISSAQFKEGPLKGFYLQTNIENKLSIYQASLQQFPDTGRSRASYDISRSSIAEDYAKKGNKEAAEQWVAKINDISLRDDAVLRVASGLYNNGDQNYAQTRLEPLIDSISRAYSQTGKDKSAYNSMMAFYVKVLKHTNQPEKIVLYLSPLYEKGGKSFESDQLAKVLTKPEEYKLEDNLSFIYASALAETGKPRMAMAVLANMYLSGEEASPELQAALKAQYLKIPGGEADFRRMADDSRNTNQARLKKFTASKKDRYGKRIDLFAKKNKYILLDFWGSWCGPCRASHPHLKELYQKYKNKGLNMIGIASEKAKTPAEERSLWIEAIEKDGLTWSQILNNEDKEKFDAVKEFSVTAYPTKILLDSEGRIVGKYVGSGNGGKALSSKLEELFR